MEQLLKDLSRFTDSLSTADKVDSYFLVKAVDGGHVTVAVGGSVENMLALYHVLSNSIKDHLVKTTVLTEEEVKELMKL